MSSCIDATCCSCDHAVKRTLDCLLVDVAASGNNSHSVKIHEAISNCWVAHHAARSKFCDQFVNTVEQNPGFLDQLIVSDEAIFSLNSEINTTNVRKYAAHGDGTQPQTQNHNSLVFLNFNDCFPKVRKTKIKEHIHLSNVSI